MPRDLWPHVCPGCSKEWNGKGTEPAFCVRCGYNQPPLLANLSDELCVFLGIPKPVIPDNILDKLGADPKPLKTIMGLQIDCPKCGRRVTVAKPSVGQGADGAAIACKPMHGGCGYILILEVEVA